jgi:thiamine pyrophosphate-dependent acetolactate synthase large subunit-like protein
MKNYVDGGEAVVQAFRCLGVDYVMSSPGSEWGPVWEAFARQTVNKAKGPEYLSCAHETLAVNLAIGYTAFTGRMQAVMLHTGVGLLQGSMGIDAAQKAGIPMLVVSGESLSFGTRADGFDPGPQWQASLSVVGGTHRLVEPLVKWCNQVSSPSTILQQLINAGEMSQRAPAGPTYMAVPIETMLHEWTPPESYRNVPAAPGLTPAAADIEKVAGLLAKAKNPVILTEASGRQPDGYSALVSLAEALSIPVVEAGWSDYSNFPKDHPLWQGVGQPPFLFESDLVLMIRCRAPWYPPQKRPAKATIVAIDEVPFRPHMVYHNVPADIFLEGDAVATIKLLDAAVRANGVKPAEVKAKAEHWAGAHKKLVDDFRAAEEKAATKKPMAPLAAVAALSKSLPKDAIYVDETITHRGLLLRHLGNQGPQSYFRVQGGLGQGLGVALGVKLAAPKRPVVSVIGDGSFMYNPVTQSLALSKHRKLPILIVILNNNGYLAMKMEHQAYYKDGVAAAHDLFYGKPITDFDYAELAKPFGGWGKTVTDLAELPAALKDGMKAVNAGNTAIVNVMVAEA